MRKYIAFTVAYLLLASQQGFCAATTHLNLLFSTDPSKTHVITISGKGDELGSVVATYGDTSGKQLHFGCYFDSTMRTRYGSIDDELWNKKLGSTTSPASHDNLSLTLSVNESDYSNMLAQITPSFLAEADTPHTFGLNNEKCIRNLITIGRSLHLRTLPYAQVSQGVAQPHQFLADWLTLLGAREHHDLGNGETFDGTLHRTDVIDGNGVYHFPDGSSYDGTLILGKRSGSAIVVAAQTKIAGVFSSDRIAGMVSVTFQNGDEYKGEICNTGLCGNGVYRFADGRSTAAEFKDNIPVSPVGLMLKTLPTPLPQALGL